MEYALNFVLGSLSFFISGRRLISCRCKQRCSDERVRFGIDSCRAYSCRAYRQSSSGSRVCLRKATMSASSSLVKTVDMGTFGPIWRSLALLRLRLLATVLGLIPYRTAKILRLSWLFCIARRVAFVVRALPCNISPIVFLSLPCLACLVLCHYSMGLYI